MERTAVVALQLLLLVLLQNSLQETEAADALKPSDQLKQLRDIMYQQGTALAELKTEMKYMEKENTVLKTKMAKQIKETKNVQNNMENLKKELSATKTKLAASDGEVQKLKKDNAGIKTALAASQGEVQSLKKEDAGIKAALAASQGEVQKLKKEDAGVKAALNVLQKENTALKGRLSTSEDDVKSLKKKVLEAPKVAFSAALTATVGPLSDSSILVIIFGFPKVITNIGGAYNPNTGYFRAPVRGVYYFRFTVCSFTKDYNSGLRLYKNSELLIHLLENNTNGYRKYFSGGNAVHLERGDLVYAHIGKHEVLFETGNDNMFTGFLLFTN